MAEEEYVLSMVLYQVSPSTMPLSSARFSEKDSTAIYGYIIIYAFIFYVANCLHSHLPIVT